MTQNEIIEVFSSAIADKFTYRVVIDFHGSHEDESMLFDFSDCGETSFTDGSVCHWSLQKLVDEGEPYSGTQELKWGKFHNYLNVFKFVSEYLNDKEYEMYADCY